MMSGSRRESDSSMEARRKYSIIKKEIPKREAVMSNLDGTSKTYKKVMVSHPLQGVLRERSEPLCGKQFISTPS